jgi:hypothetical protein
MVLVLVDKQRLEEYRLFDKHMSLWERLQRQGVDHCTSPCDPRKMLLIKSAKEWKYCLKVHPDFFQLRTEIKKFNKLFKGVGIKDKVSA